MARPPRTCSHWLAARASFACTMSIMRGARSTWRGAFWVWVRGRRDDVRTAALSGVWLARRDRDRGRGLRRVPAAPPAARNARGADAHWHRGAGAHLRARVGVQVHDDHLFARHRVHLRCVRGTRDLSARTSRRARASRPVARHALLPPHGSERGRRGGRGCGGATEPFGDRLHHRARARDRARRFRAEREGDAGQGERRSARDDLHSVFAVARRRGDHPRRHDRRGRVHPPAVAGAKHRAQARHAPSGGARTLRGERRARHRGERGNRANLCGPRREAGAWAHGAAASRHHRRWEAAHHGRAPAAQRLRLTSDARVSVGAAAILFAAYVGTLAPGLTMWDAGEFIAAVKTFGIPHQPGTPLYVLLARTWTIALPFAATALATNLFSAVCTAAAGGLLAAFIARAGGSRAMALASAP